MLDLRREAAGRVADLPVLREAAGGAAMLRPEVGTWCYAVVDYWERLHIVHVKIFEARKHALTGEWVYRGRERDGGVVRVYFDQLTDAMLFETEDEAMCHIRATRAKAQQDADWWRYCPACGRPLEAHDDGR